LSSRLKFLVFGFTGLAAALSLANHFFGFFRRSPGVQAGLWLGLGAACTAGLYLLWRWRSRRERASPAARLAWLAVCLGAAALLMLLIPGLTPRPPRLHTLEIRAGGEKNPASAGSEVGLLRLLLGQEPLEFEQLTPRGIWQTSPREMLSDGPQPASLFYRFRYTADHSLQVIFAAGPAGGEALVDLDGESKRVDLYDPQPDRKRSVQLTVQDAPDPGWSIVLYLADSLTLGALLFLLIPGASWLERRLPAGYNKKTSEVSEDFGSLSPSLAASLSLQAEGSDLLSPEAASLSLQAEGSDLLSPEAASLSLQAEGSDLLSPEAASLSLQAKRSNLPSLLLVVLFNLAAVIAILYLFEAGLRLLDPARRLPPNGLVDGQLYTWGHVVVNNSQGFRDGEWASPKPAGVCRIAVLGDSLTWGQGLAVEQRYTQVLQGLLQERFPQKNIQVLNFGIQGLPTTQERDLLRKYKDRLQPDQVVVGFCYNDPQPHSQDFVAERVLFEQSHPLLANGLPDFLEQVGLKRLAERYRFGLGQVGLRLGLYPDWPVGVDRTYQPGSKEWQAFVGALEDIRRMSDEMGLPSPLFAVLSEGSYPDRPVNLEQPDSYQQHMLRWYAQAGAAAQQAGFQAFDYNQEIARAFASQPMAVNFLDGHPNAEANRIYAQKIFAILAERIERGDLCR
jgi:hypothetical protein